MMNKTCKLVVAEDSESDFLLLEIALQETPEVQLIHRSRHGGEMIEYLSGQGAYADRERYPWPDLLLLDLNMPLCDGLGVLRWMKQQSLATTPRVIVFSSSSVHADRELALALGADDYQVKPSDYAQYVAIIKQIAAGANVAEHLT